MDSVVTLRSVKVFRSFATVALAWRSSFSVVEVTNASNCRNLLRVRNVSINLRQLSSRN